MRNITVNFRKNLSWSIVEICIQVVTKGGYGLLVAREFGPETIGKYALFISIISVSTMLSEGGLGKWLISKKSLDIHDMSLAYSINVIIATILSFLSLVVLGFLNAYSSFTYEWFYFLAVLTVALNSLKMVRLSSLKREGRYDLKSKIFIVSNVISVLISTFFLIYLNRPEFILPLQVLLNVTIQLAMIVLSSKIVFTVVLNYQMLVAVLKESRYFLYRGFLNKSSLSLLNIAILNGYGPVALGVFSQGKSLQTMSSEQVGLSYSSIVLSDSIKKEKESLFQGVKFNLILYVFAPILCCLGMASEYWTFFLLGEEWSNYTSEIGFLLSEGPLIFLFIYLSHLAYYQGRSRLVFRFELISLVLRLTLCLLFAGNMFSLLSAFLIMSGLRVILFQEFLGFYNSRLIMFRDRLMILALSLVVLVNLN